MNIRTFQFEQDLEAVSELWSSAGQGIRLGSSDSALEIKKKTKRDPDLFLVAEIKDNLIGTVLGGFDGRRGMVYHLAIDRDYQRQGIGQNLMQELELRLRAKGCLKYYLLVTKDNEEAIDFYESIGCEVMILHLLGKSLS